MPQIGEDLKWFIIGGLVGGFIGALLAKVFDPPPPEVVEAIAKSEWARHLAEKYVSPDLPPEVREKMIEQIARELAEKAAIKLFP